jgi:hypothetical protein
MTSGQIVLLVAAWAAVSVPCSLLVASFIGFGAETAGSCGNPAYEETVREAA